MTGIDLSDALKIVKQTERELKREKGEMTGKNSDKLQKVLQSNLLYWTLCKTNIILNGLEAKFYDFKPVYSPDELAFHTFVPITSCDFKWNFSRYKTLLTEKMSFEFDNL